MEREAKANKPPLVIARRAKPDAAIHGGIEHCTTMDCFVVPLLAMTRFREVLKNKKPPEGGFLKFKTRSISVEARTDVLEASFDQRIGLRALDAGTQNVFRGFDRSFSRSATHFV